MTLIEKLEREIKELDIEVRWSVATDFYDQANADLRELLEQAVVALKCK